VLAHHLSVLLQLPRVSHTEVRLLEDDSDVLEREALDFGVCVPDGDPAKETNSGIETEGARGCCICVEISLSEI
jgi:hypothetical protein